MVLGIKETIPYHVCHSGTESSYAVETPFEKVYNDDKVDETYESIVEKMNHV